MLTMAVGEFILTWIALYSAIVVEGVDEPCRGAVEAVANVAGTQVAQEMVFTSMSSSSNVGKTCGLQLSCCTPVAEDVLKANITQIYQDSLHQLLQDTIPGCINSSLLSDSVAAMEDAKSSLIETMMYLLEENYTSEFDTVFDGFFNYVEKGIMKLDLCELEMQHQSMFFEVYLTTFKRFLELDNKNTDPLSDASFRNCFYQYFIAVHGASISNEYHRVEQRYNIFLRYLQALATSDEVLKTVLNHVLSPECQDSLLRMTHCAQCAGVNDPLILPCNSLCQNVQRGCLVDIYELGYVYKRFYNELRDTMYDLDQYDPFGSMRALPSQVLNILDDFQYGYSEVADSVTSQCGMSFSARKRSVPTQIRTRQHLKMVRRQTVDPLDTLADTVTCAKSVYSLLQDVARRICVASNVNSDNTNCWNGTDVGSYGVTIKGKGRIYQLNNPEVQLTSTTGLLYLDAIAQLKNMTAQLEECVGKVENCAIKLCNRSIPSPTDYNLATETRYAQFTITDESLSAMPQTSTPIPSLAPQTSVVDLIPTTSIPMPTPTPQASVVDLMTTPLVDRSDIAYSFEATHKETTAVVEKTSMVIPSSTLQASMVDLLPTRLPEQASGELEASSSIVTNISLTLLITSLLSTVLL